MQQGDYRRFVSLMMTLAEVFRPDKELSKQLLEIYYRALSDLSIEDVERACIELIRKKTIPTFPLVGEIRQALIDETESLRAWLTAQEAVRRWGAYMSVQFSDHAIHSVIDAMGGWIKFCHIPEEEVKWAQKEFERLYGVMKGKKTHPPRLSGIFELQNAAAGYEVDGQMTVLIECDTWQSTGQLERTDCNQAKKAGRPASGW